jgi:hypothetical protein
MPVHSIRKVCTGFPDRVHWITEKAALHKRNIQIKIKLSIIAIKNSAEDFKK